MYLAGITRHQTSSCSFMVFVFFSSLINVKFVVPFAHPHYTYVKPSLVPPASCVFDSRARRCWISQSSLLWRAVQCTACKFLHFSSMPMTLTCDQINTFGLAHLPLRRHQREVSNHLTERSAPNFHFLLSTGTTSDGRTSTGLMLTVITSYSLQAPPAMDGPWLD